jgi:hypothetical protein
MSCSPLCKGVLKKNYYPLVFPELVYVWKHQLEKNINLQNRIILERKIQILVTSRVLIHQINKNNNLLRKFENYTNKVFNFNYLKGK